MAIDKDKIIPWCQAFVGALIAAFLVGGVVVAHNIITNRGVEGLETSIQASPVVIRYEPSKPAKKCVTNYRYDWSKKDNRTVIRTVDDTALDEFLKDNNDSFAPLDDTLPECAKDYVFLPNLIDSSPGQTSRIVHPAAFRIEYVSDTISEQVDRLVKQLPSFDIDYLRELRNIG